MKDNENFKIIKAVSHCVHEGGCAGCPYEFEQGCASIQELLYYVDYLIDERDRCLEALSELSENIVLLKDKAQADAVRKMHNKIKERAFNPNNKFDFIYDEIDQIAKEMLEGNYE